MELSSKVYHEKQKINKLFTILIVFFAGILPVGSYISTFYFVFSNFDRPFYFKETLPFYLSGFFIFILSAFIIYIFLNLKLELIISQEGLFFRLFPFHRKYRFIAYTDIRSYSVRRFRPILEYGGWGIRYSIKRNGIAYTLTGSCGLQLELNSFKRMMIGIKSPDMVLQFLKLYIPNKHIENKDELNI